MENNTNYNNTSTENQNVTASLKKFYPSDRELLSCLTKATSTSMESIKDLLGESKEYCECCEILKKEYDAYEKIYKEATDGLRSISEEAVSIGSFQKAIMWSSVKISTMGNCNQSKVAQMVIEGTSRGVVEVSKKLNEYREVSSVEAISLAERFLEHMSNLVDEMKKLL